MSDRDKVLTHQQSGAISYYSGNGERFTVQISGMDGDSLNLAPGECIVLYGHESKIKVERRLKLPVLNGEAVAHAARDLIEDRWPHALLTLTEPDPTAAPTAVLSANLVTATREALGIKPVPQPKPDEVL